MGSWPGGGQHAFVSAKQLIISSGVQRRFFLWTFLFLLTSLFLPVCLAYGQTQPAPFDPSRQYVFGADSPVTATHPGSQQRPAISGNIAVWEDQRPCNCPGNPSRIFYKDLSSNADEQPLVSVPGSGSTGDTQTDPAIDGNLVVWLQGGSGIHYMYLSNGQPGTDQILNVPFLAPTWLSVSGHRIVWEDEISGIDQIYMYDLNSGQLVDVSADQSTDACEQPTINGDNVAWVDAMQSEVYLKNVASGTLTRVTIDGANTYKEQPSISGDYMTWWKNGGVVDSGGGVFLYNISDGSTRMIANDRFDYNAKIAGNTVVWDKFTNQEDQIYMCDITNLGNQTTVPATRVSNGTAVLEYPQVSGSYIIWGDDRLGTSAIFMNKLGDTAQTLADKYSPVLILHHNEIFEPKPVEFALNMPGTYLRSSVNQNFLPIANPSPSQLQTSSGDYIDLPGNAKSTCSWCGFDLEFIPDYVLPYLASENNYPDKVYSHIVISQNGEVSIQYWYFYYVNNFADFHEGDWEMVDVFLDNNLNPIYCAYSNHDDAIWRDWGQVEGSGLGTHPVSYVANGSHANYFDAGFPGIPFFGNYAGLHWVKINGLDLPIADYTDDNGKILPIHNVQVLPDVPVSPNDDIFGWLAFSGNWGELNTSRNWCNPTQDRSGPFGPSAHGTEWSDPFTLLTPLTCDSCQDESSNQTDLEITRHSPVDIKVYDSQGRVMAKTLGPNDVPIPGAEYLDYPELDRASIVIHGGNIEDGYRIEADGSAPGTAGLTITAPDHQGGTVDTLNYNNVQVSPTTKITMNVDSSKNYTATVDEYGDGTAVTQKAPDTTITNTVDFTPPAQVTDLAGTNSAYGTATLNFTAPGDDGNTGTATSYDIRYSTSAISDQYWKDAVPVETPAPLAAGSAQSATVTGLAPGATYYFALKATDKVGLQSPLSNVASVYVPADTAAPVISNLQPGGYIASTSPVISASYSDADPSSGINAASATVSLNGAPPIACSALSGTVSCPVNGLTDGSYSYTISLADNAGNTGTATGSFFVDTAAPQVSGISPAGNINTTSPVISASYSDSGSGINSSTARVSLDGTTLSGCTATSASISCPTAGLAQGSHAVNVSVTDNAGNTASATGTFFADTAAPVISTIQPSGSGNGASLTISASYQDPSPTSGISPATASVKLDGATLNGCTASATGVSCPATGLIPGSHSVTVQVSDLAGNTATASGTFNVSRNYLWAWYDNASSGYSDWILMANPAAPTNPDLWFDLLIGSLSEPLPSLTGKQPGQVPYGSVLTAQYPGVLGGPVKAISTTGAGAVLSQRTLLTSGSLEEVPATDEGSLSDHYYWAWYDASTGTTDWVMVTNQNPNPVYCEITIAGNRMHDPLNPANAYFTIPAGGHIAPTFPGTMGGPLEVQAWTDSNKQTAAKVVATQRVLTNNGSAFNELPGTPAAALASSYLWTWYDNKSTGASDWVMVINQSAASIYYEITIAGQLKASGTLTAGAHATPQFGGVIGGPVQVSAWTSSTKQTPANVIASQRSLFGPSFEEVPGFPEALLTSDYNWTWYDNKSTGASDWVMVVNPSSTASIYYEVRIPGQQTASGTLQPGAYVTPTFPGVASGPVEVQAWTDSSKQTAAKVIASQRVLWNGYFNEVVGVSLD